MLSKKNLKFKKVLESAKKALDEISIPFHLHSGTSLGAHREKTFIAHDNDIDLAVFYNDVKTMKDVKNIKESMKRHGFTLIDTLGKLDIGFELKFLKNNVPLDIFWVYDGFYKGKKFYILTSYYGYCDQFPHKMCVWGYKPYNVVKINFMGNIYNSIPKKTLVDMYGKDWNIVKKFDYYDGIENNLYKGLLKDYYL
jgi:hypothetical protein